MSSCLRIPSVGGGDLPWIYRISNVKIVPSVIVIILLRYVMSFRNFACVLFRIEVLKRDTWNWDRCVYIYIRKRMEKK